MVLIPNDVGIRMRMETEANLLQPVRPITGIPSDLPELQMGQRFTARIQEVLPENTYKALVAGKSLTLSLPEGAKTGDTLELVLVDRTPKVLVARLVPQQASAEAGQPYQFTTLSRAGQLIGSLLPAEGESPAAVALNRGQPVLAGPPQTSTQLAPALATAVKQSGLFYESHQVQWISGRLPLQQLLLEPQGQHSDPQTLAAQGVEQAVSNPASAPLQGRRDGVQIVLQAMLGRESTPVSAASGGPPGSATAAPASTPPPGSAAHGLEQAAGNPADAEKSALAGRRADLPTTLQPPLGRESTAASGGPPGSTTVTTAAGSPSGSPPASSAAAQQVPEELRPLVQQQLDAVSTQRLAWHGEVWPNQHMEWEVEWREGRASEEGSEDDSNWTTSLRLTTPRLGEVNARLQLSAAGVRVAIVTPLDSSAADLRGAVPALEQSLAAAGVPLLGLLVQHLEEPAT